MTRNQADSRANEAKPGDDEGARRRSGDKRSERREKSDKDGGETETVLETVNDEPRETAN